MRISDWSSDVCSSDLHLVYGSLHKGRSGRDRLFALIQTPIRGRPSHVDHAAHARISPVRCASGPRRGLRSEEHTSELQSLMRISYAVFCLKKKTHVTNIRPIPIHRLIYNNEQA